jgi:hypothetical protein
MSRRATGAIFVAIAAFLFAIRYIVAVLYTPDIGPWSAEEFGRYLGYIDRRPWQLAAIALVIGIGYLLWGERTEQS